MKNSEGSKITSRSIWMYHTSRVWLQEGGLGGVAGQGRMGSSLEEFEFEVLLLSGWPGKLCQRSGLELELRALSPYVRFLKPTMWVRLPREGRWSKRELGRALMGLLRDKESMKATNKDRKEIVVLWKPTVEHFRRRVCSKCSGCTGPERFLPGVKYPLKLVVRRSLVTSAKTSVVLYRQLKPNHRRLRCNGRWESESYWLFWHLDKSVKAWRIWDFILLSCYLVSLPQGHRCWQKTRDSWIRSKGLCFFLVWQAAWG